MMRSKSATINKALVEFMQASLHNVFVCMVFLVRGWSETEFFFGGLNFVVFFIFCSDDMLSVIEFCMQMHEE